MAKKSRKLSEALEAFGELPPEVLGLGKPASVHPLGLLGRGPSLENPTTWLVVAAGGLLTGAVGLAFYLSGTPLGRGTADGWLILVGGGAFLAAVGGVWAWLASRRGGAGKVDRVRGLILYPDAVVRLREKGFDLIRWADVKELHAPASTTVWTVVADDDRRIELPVGVARQTEAILNLCRSVAAVLQPRYAASLDAGKRVTFGPFGVSRRFVYSKGDKLAWADVTRLEFVNGRFQVRRGGLLPWCDYDLMAYPNGFLAGELVRQVAPPELLVAGDRPQW